MSEQTNTLIPETTPDRVIPENDSVRPLESPRPGKRLGEYPEREIELESAFANGLSHISRLKIQQRYSRESVRKEFIERVNRSGDLLKEKTEPELDMFRQQLQAQLRRLGLNEGLVAQVFALVRELAGRKLGKRHYDVQLIGGWYLTQGILAEMETGEGKTLTATLAASVAALADIPVHVITVNDYLATRDAEAMRPLYEALGLTVGVVTADAQPAERQAAYDCNIAYCTNKQLVFDYLRDRVSTACAENGLSSQLKALHQGKSDFDQTFLRGLCFGIIDEADSILIDEARTPLILSRPGDTCMQTEVCRVALKMAGKMKSGRHYVLNQKERMIKLSAHGKKRMQQVAEKLGGAWKGRKRREEWLVQALTALHLFEQDKHYLVRNGKVEIIDASTGRTLPDRSWERGLHQMIEYKEGCEISDQQETLARISYQRFFRRYLHLCGMSGTAREVAGELWSVYRLPVVSVPTHRPSKLKRFPDQILIDNESKWDAVINEIRIEMLEAKRPVLVGTGSVRASEELSERLKEANLPHQVLNARQDNHEAEIVAKAGHEKQLTVATNMAGRGTDIVLGKGVEHYGGLHVIATERYDARRIDRQLFGRSARQGVPGSCHAILSIEDELPTQYLPSWLLKIMPVSPEWLQRKCINAAQSSAQRHHRAIRRDLQKHDEQLEDLLAFSGNSE
ncbi:MAG: preprotein translocase subunit SecA [Gammaproteobacteria bacterium]